MPITADEFLKQYREAIPKLEKSLFRNKHIEAELCSHDITNKPKPSVWRNKVVFKSNHDKYIELFSIPKPNKTTIRVFRPDQFYILEQENDGLAKATLDRAIPDTASEAFVQSAWWAHPWINTTAGIGHGLLNYEQDWYSAISGDKGSISRVTETTDAGRSCYRVEVPSIADWGLKDVTLYFDKPSLMLRRVTSTKTLADGSKTQIEGVLEFEIKPGDYDSIVITSYKMFVENKQLSLPRHVQIEHIYSVYKTATHPAETFRLEQFGLPDVAERPRATSRRSIGFVIAGVALGGFLLVAWLRGRRAAKTA